ncbi:MAG TPA: hypothetical protein VHY09_14825, partial [Candidatus Methylacidiphilales bacterium]|nr:hypothetical protein [Candidatus Methylacidiphilales bacterium]
MKMLFMFREEVLPHFSRGTEITGDNFYEFFPWDFGPFSSQVYDDLSFFILRGFVKNSLSQEEATLEAAAEWQKWVAGGPSDEANEAVSEFQEEEFTLAERGVSFTKKLYDQLTDNQKRLLLEFK